MLRPWEFQLTIEPDSAKPIYLQITDGIIDAIKQGKLKPKDMLPGSRLLGSQLKVNRNTVIQALEILLAEGWLMSKERRGTFVSNVLPEFLLNDQNREKEMLPQQKIEPLIKISFDDGLPDSRLAPLNELARAYRQIFSRKGRWQMMGYSQESGDEDFKKAITHMLNFKRTMGVSSSNIFITRGSQMALYLTAQTLIQAKDIVVVENPGYKAAWDTFSMAGATVVPIDVDDDGIKISVLKDLLLKGTKIKAVYVTPHHQFPTTVTLSLSRRLELISLSNLHGFIVIEDDYDHEFHFGPRPLMPLCSNGNLRNFVYIGTMSKIVAPALRIGYLTTTAENLQKISVLRKMIDVQGDNIMEQAVLQLINDGEIKRHLKKASTKYKTKRDYLEFLILKYLGGKVKYRRPEGGLAFWIQPINEFDLETVADNLEKKGVRIVRSDNFGTDKPVRGLRLGFASLTEIQLEEGIKALGEVL